MTTHSASTNRSRITVVGVGDGGAAVIDRMIENGMSGVRFVAVNAAARDLERSHAPLQVSLGLDVLRDALALTVATAASAAEARADDLAFPLMGSQMIFVVCGLGGSTGTGAAPVLAQVGRTLGATVIGVAMLPCAIEGAGPAQRARDGLSALETRCDAVVAVPGDRLLALTSATASLHQIHRAVDGVLLRCIEDVCALVTTPGVINLDVADIRAIFDGGGKTLLALGAATGQDRARAAAERAITSRWLNATLDGARDIVFNITAGPGLSLFEINEVAGIIRAVARPDSRVLYGAQVDDRAGASLRITLLATGM